MEVGDQFIIPKVPDVIYTVIKRTSNKYKVQLPSGNIFSVPISAIEANILYKQVIVITKPDTDVDSVLPVEKETKKNNYFNFDDI